MVVLVHNPNGKRGVHKLIVRKCLYLKQNIFRFQSFSLLVNLCKNDALLYILNLIIIIFSKEL